MLTRPVHLVHFDRRWSQPVRLAQAGFGFFAFILLGFATLMALIEIGTSPRFSRTALIVWAGCTVLETLHVYVLARFPGRSTKKSWLIFIAAILAMIWNNWNVVADPRAKVFLTSLAIGGALWIGMMRLMSIGLGNWLHDRPVYSWIVAAIAWLPLVAYVIVLVRIP
ncbi:MAG: hypothetical protein HEQ23_16640 [Tepidisphaera sp.]